MKSGSWARWLAAAALPVWLGACAESTRTLAPVSGPVRATSDRSAVRLFEWALNQSAPEVLDQLFSADFELASAGLDSAGNPSRGALERDSVLIGFRAMLEGVPGRCPSADVGLWLDRNLISFPDTRPGRDPRVHRVIRSSIVLQVREESGSVFEVAGSLLFLATRGDSAAIPPGAAAEPDSLHWWLAGIEDETVSGAGRGASAHPAGTVTLRVLLDRYRSCALSAGNDPAAAR